MVGTRYQKKQRGLLASASSPFLPRARRDWSQAKAMG